MLTSIDVVKEFLIDTSDKDDVRITSALTRASAFIEKYCARTFAQATYNNELQDGNGTDVMNLKNFPIISVSSVLEYGTSLVVGTDPAASPTPDVLIYHAQGQLIRLTGVWHRARNYYSVSYVAGYSAVPQEIVEAAVELTMIMLKEKDRVGLAQHTTSAVTSTYLRSLPEAAQRALDLHRDLVLGRAA